MASTATIGTTGRGANRGHPGKGRSAAAGRAGGQKKQRTRQRLAEAAAELFYERGYDATTIDDIAAAVDVSPRTFYRYFPTKEDLVVAMGRPASSRSWPPSGRDRRKSPYWPRSEPPGPNDGEFLGKFLAWLARTLGHGTLSLLGFTREAFGRPLNSLS